MANSTAKPRTDLDRIEEAVLDAIAKHPGVMSAPLLSFLLVGEPFGRMAEKGLVDTPFFGMLADLDADRVCEVVRQMEDDGLLESARGYYPALTMNVDRVQAELRRRAKAGR